MKHLLLSLITGLSVLSPLAASAAPMSILKYEAITQFSSRWERPENRKLIEERIRINQTNGHTGLTNEAAVKADIKAGQKTSDAYLCRSLTDMNRCVPSATAQDANR